MRKGLGSYLRDNRQPGPAAAALSRVRVTTRHATQLAQAASARRNAPMRNIKMLTQARQGQGGRRARRLHDHTQTHSYSTLIRY